MAQPRKPGLCPSRIPSSPSPQGESLPQPSRHSAPAQQSLRPSPGVSLCPSPAESLPQPRGLSLPQPRGHETSDPAPSRPQSTCKSPTQPRAPRAHSHMHTAEIMARQHSTAESIHARAHTQPTTRCRRTRSTFLLIRRPRRAPRRSAAGAGPPSPLPSRHPTAVLPPRPPLLAPTTRASAPPLAWERRGGAREERAGGGRRARRHTGPALDPVPRSPSRRAASAARTVSPRGPAPGRRVPAYPAPAMWAGGFVAAAAAAS
jgi:hypothetical protein